MVSEADSQGLNSQYHKSVRNLRTMIMRQKKMRRMHPYVMVSESSCQSSVSVATPFQPLGMTPAPPTTTTTTTLPQCVKDSNLRHVKVEPNVYSPSYVLQTNPVGTTLPQYVKHGITPTTTTTTTTTLSKCAKDSNLRHVKEEPSVYSPSYVLQTNPVGTTLPQYVKLGMTPTTTTPPPPPTTLPQCVKDSNLRHVKVEPSVYSPSYVLQTNPAGTTLPQYVKESHLRQDKVGSVVYTPTPTQPVGITTTTLPQCMKDDSHLRQDKAGSGVSNPSPMLQHPFGTITTLPQCVKVSHLQQDRRGSNVYSHYPMLLIRPSAPVGNPEHVLFRYTYPLAYMQKQARIFRMSVLRGKRGRSKFPRASRTEHSPQMNDPMPSNEGRPPSFGEGNRSSPQWCDSHFPTVKRGVPFSWGAFWGFPLPPPPKAGKLSEKVVKDGSKESKGVYVGVVEDDSAMDDKFDTDNEEDDVADIWKEMDFAMECCKEISEGQLSDEHDSSKEDDDDCDHSFILKDDLGYVCRVCGLVQKEIQEVFEFLYPKRARTKSYRQEPMKNEDKNPEKALPDWCKLPRMDLDVTEVLAHSRHLKHMKRHQIEGFNFLSRNLVTENPHGCILAHAPGSGKTFMLICFIHSFLAKYPTARPLVILPKGILSTWKKEFQKWQIEEIPLYDFYSAKAINRSQQLAVLKQWVEQKSILFLGYKQFSTIVTGNATSTEMASCQEILVRIPTVLILDEGHTPRNKETNALESLTRVQTPRKVVLSGTLYQNHVKEVFNILNLVQPRFLKIDANREIVGRIMSKVEISGVRKQMRAAGDGAFYDLIESTLLKDENKQRKVGIIKDLREMTCNVLHYYKGDSFDELPGLEDFTVLLNLSPKQRAEVDKFTKSKERKFKSSSLGSAIYLHPKLKQFSGSRSEVNDENIDKMLEKMNHRDGVKAMFFLNILRLCEISQEKLLVFSHYILPLKFLERLAMHVKGWSHGKEIYKITGESTTDHREWSMERFNSSSDARVFFGSVKACGEGISLVGASRILILDVHPNPSVSWQAVCRAFRPGQLKKVYTYRLVAADSPEEEDHSTCFKKELIAKMWFEWDENSKRNDFESEAIDLDDCGDAFLQNPLLGKDIKALYKR